MMTPADMVALAEVLERQVPEVVRKSFAPLPIDVSGLLHVPSFADAWAGRSFTPHPKENDDAGNH